MDRPPLSFGMLILLSFAYVASEFPCYITPIRMETGNFIASYENVRPVDKWKFGKTHVT